MPWNRCRFEGIYRYIPTIHRSPQQPCPPPHPSPVRPLWDRRRPRHRQAIALALGEAGAEVVVNYSSSAVSEAVVETITASGGQHAVQANVAIEDEVDGLIKTVLERSGRLQCAGEQRDHPRWIADADELNWQSVIDLNLTGVFLCSRAVARPMLKQKSGRIINITSVVGLMGNAGIRRRQGRVIGLTRSTAKEPPVGASPSMPSHRDSSPRT